MAKLDKEVREAAEKAAANEIAETEPAPVTDLEQRIGLPDLIAGIEALVAEGPDEESEMLDRIIGEIFSAQSVDDLLEEGSTLEAEDVLNETLTVWSINFNPTDFEESPIPFYASFHVTRHKTQQKTVVNCGGIRVVPKAFLMARAGEFPIVLSFYERGRKKEGRRAVLDIRRPQVGPDNVVPF